MKKLSTAKAVRLDNAASAQWHETKRGWTRTVGTGENRFIVMQLKPGGPYFARIGPANAQRQVSLQTSVRDEAETFALEYLAQRTAPVEDSFEPAGDEAYMVVAAPLPDAPPKVLTLFLLTCMYVGSSRFSSRNKASTRQKLMSTLQILVAAMGPGLDVALLDRNDIDGYIEARRRGGIAYTDFRVMADGAVRPYRRVTGPVKWRSIDLELTQLGAMVTWATDTRCANRSSYLLDKLELRGSLTKDVPSSGKTPRQIMPRESVARLISTAMQLAKDAAAQDTRELARRWYRIALALLIVDVTGERIGAVRQLRRTNLKFVARGPGRELQLTYVAETIKGGEERTVPFPGRESDLIYRLLLELSVIGGGPLFPRELDGDPMTTDQMIDELTALMQIAGVDDAKGSKWHGIRALWATERRNGDLKAARIAGGWKDAATFMSYIRTSMDDIRRAIADPRVEIVLPGDETARPKGGPVLRLFGGRRPSAFQRNG